MYLARRLKTMVCFDLAGIGNPTAQSGPRHACHHALIVPSRPRCRQSAPGIPPPNAPIPGAAALLTGSANTPAHPPLCNPAAVTSDVACSPGNRHVDNADGVFGRHTVENSLDDVVIVFYSTLYAQYNKLLRTIRDSLPATLWPSSPCRRPAIQPRHLRRDGIDRHRSNPARDP